MLYQNSFEYSFTRKAYTPKKSDNNSLTFITTYNPSNRSFYETMEKSIEHLKQNKVDGFENLRVIKSKRQALSLKKIQTEAEFFQEQVGVFECPDKRCECCTSFLLGNSDTFKNVAKH